MSQFGAWLSARASAPRSMAGTVSIAATADAAASSRPTRGRLALHIHAVQPQREIRDRPIAIFLEPVPAREAIAIGHGDAFKGLWRNPKATMGAVETLTTWSPSGWEIISTA